MTEEKIKAILARLETLYDMLTETKQKIEETQKELVNIAFEVTTK